MLSRRVHVDCREINENCNHQPARKRPTSEQPVKRQNRPEKTRLMFTRDAGLNIRPSFARGAELWRGHCERERALLQFPDVLPQRGVLRQSRFKAPASGGCEPAEKVIFQLVNWHWAFSHNSPSWFFAMRGDRAGCAP